MSTLNRRAWARSALSLIVFMVLLFVPAGTFHFRMVHRPRAVQAEIFAHIEAARGRQQEQELERRRAEMLDWFSIYDEMRQSRPLPPPQDEETE